MKLQHPFIQLPLLFDATALADEVLAVEESCWKPHPEGFAGNSMLPLVAVNGDPDNEGFAGPMQVTPHLLRCPYLTQVIASFGATAGRSRLMRLAGASEVRRHVDQGYYWAERVRIHVPIVTQPTVRFKCGGIEINMAAGECWIFDTWRQHRVLNDATESRIHLVVDSVGGEQFWDLVGRGRAHDQANSDWKPNRIAPVPGELSSFAVESLNVPVVMSPWELSSHFSFLFGEALAHPNLQAVQVMSAHLLRNWRGLWAQYGDAKEGHVHFSALIDRFTAQVEEPSRPLQMRNGVTWYSSLMLLVLISAVNGGRRKASREYGIADRA